MLVEDNEADVYLTLEAFKNCKLRNAIHVVKDGVEAMGFLRKEGEYSDVARTDIILLDLNMPRKDGRETLKEIKEDPDLKSIPVVVLTTSEGEQDILKSYNLHANCYITKPVDFQQFIEVVKQIENFWFTVVKLPQE